MSPGDRLRAIAAEEAAAVYGSAPRPRQPVRTEPAPAPRVDLIAQAVDDARLGAVRAVELADALADHTHQHRRPHLTVVPLAASF